MEAEVVVEEPGPLDGGPRRADGFAALYRQEYAPMVRLAHTGSNEVAEDVVQEAFVKMHQHWDRAAQPGAYLRMTVVNGCRSWHRRRRLERERMPRPAPEAVEPESRELLDALARLGVRQRTALVLRFYADLSEADVAVALDCRPGTGAHRRSRREDGHDDRRPPAPLTGLLPAAVKRPLRLRGPHGRQTSKSQGNALGGEGHL